MRLRQSYRPNRLVELSRAAEIQIAEDILVSLTAFISSLVEDGTLHFDQNLGDLVGEEGYYIDLYDAEMSGQRVKVIVQNPCAQKSTTGMGYALSKFFTSGDYAPTLDRSRVYASSCRTVSDWLEPNYHRTRLRDFLDVWLHEETHRSDLGLRRGGVGYHGGAQKVGSDEGQMPVGEYVNLPAEVKAFGRNICEEAARSAEFIVSGAPGMAPSTLRKFQTITRQKRGERPLEYLIRDTPTWKNIVGSGLSEDNQRRILRDVYLQLEEDGWVAAVEQTLSDPTLTANRRRLRPNAPLSGFDLFDMEDEPEVSATPRGAYEQAVGAPASRQPAHTLLRSSKLPVWLASAAADGLYVATTPTGQGAAYMLSWFVDLPPSAKANNTTARALRSALISRRDLPSSEYALHKAPLYLFDHASGQLVRFVAPATPNRRSPARFTANHPQHAEDLAQYLNQRFDPGDYLYLAEKLFGEDVDVYELSEDDLGRLEWAVQADESRLGVDCDTPAYRILERAVMAPPGQWYIHFSEHGGFNRFAYGATLENLALSKVCGKRKDAGANNTQLETPYFEVVWGFAFPANTSAVDLRAGARKYGSRAGAHFVLFRSDEAVVAYHTGDDETQAIFVVGSEYDVVAGTFSGSSDWAVEDESGETIEEFSSLGEILAWYDERFGSADRLPASVERSRWATPNAIDLPAWMDYQERYVKEHWPDAKLLGYGSNGTAWDVGDHVVKYTISDEEVGVLTYLIEEDIGGFIPQVFSITEVAGELPDLGGFVIEREPAEPVLQAFQSRGRKDQAALRRLLKALDRADDGDPSRKHVLAAANAAENVDGGETFAAALRELWERGMMVHDLRADNLGVTADGRLVLYDPGWFEAV